MKELFYGKVLTKKLETEMEQDFFKATVTFADPHLMDNGKYMVRVTNGKSKEVSQLIGYFDHKDYEFTIDYIHMF